MSGRSILSGALVAIACGGVAASCGSDDAPPGPSAGGTLGDGGIPDGSSGASGSNGTGGTGASGGTGATGGSGASGGTGGTSGASGSGTGASGGTGGASGSTGSGGTGAAGSAGTNDGGGADAGGSAGAGPDTGPDVVPCPACDGGPCTSSGTCVECTRNEHCSGAESYCDTVRNECVQCLQANDTCPAGEYCTDQGTCAKGCKNGASCASGICLPSRDCARCVNNGECSGSKLCGSGVCAEACSAGGPPGQCGSGFSCCEPRCVDVNRDIGHCGACGTFCGNDEFCGIAGGTIGCLDALFPNVCRLSIATALMDVQSQDVAAAQAALTGMTTHCAPAPTTRSVDQEAAEAINPATGRVVQSGGELLILVGGPFLNLGVRYMENTRQVPVYNSGNFPAVGYYRSADLTPIVTGVFDGTGRHDFFVVQLGRDLTTGTLALVIYGFHANGTRAAAWYFANRMLPDLSAYPGKYYVYEWTDGNDDGLPDNSDTFDLRGSG